jgi:hypothetical protein
VRGGNLGRNVGRGLSGGTSLPPRADLPGEARECRGVARQELACGGPVWGLDEVDVAVGWRVGGVGRVEGASVNGWSLGALNVAARWAFMVGVGAGSRWRRARAAFLSWVAMPWRGPMLTSCLTDSANLEALQL